MYKFRPKMLKRLIGTIILVNLHVAYVTNSCKTCVYLNWKVTLHEFKLTCKVSKLLYKVWILDQFGNKQAYCIPPTPFSTCDTTYRNASISQNAKTNETTFTVHGHIDNHINGKWTCRHGRLTDEAQVEVTVLRIQEKYNITKFNENRNNSISRKPMLRVLDTSCIKNVLLMATLSYFGSVTLSVLWVTCFKTGFKGIDDCCKMVSKGINCKIKTSTKILVCKRIAFVIVSVIYVAMAALYGLFDNRNCDSKWIFMGLGLIFGVINSKIFLSNVDTVDPRNRRYDGTDTVAPRNRLNDDTDPTEEFTPTETTL